jgi:RND family efflux transporter MFP subunit
MVLGVCRRHLSNPQDADDAFQATFLTLVKKAGSVVNGSALASWLYQVAYRVALRARISLARRAHRERPGMGDLAGPANSVPTDPELRRVLDDEVSRLPRRHREAFVLCCLEGKSGAEAARLLGCRPGTVSSRLTRARERLRRRLLRRGIAPAIGVEVALLEGDAGAATTPVTMIHSTLQAAMSFAAGEADGGALSPQAVTLAKGALRTMYLSQLKVIALWLLVTCAFTGGVVWTLQALAAGPSAPENGNQLSEEARGGQPQKGLPVVQVAKPCPGGLERSTQQPCSVYAYEELKVIPRASGIMNALSVDIGSRVKKGQVLAEIDAPQLVLEERQAGAAVRQVTGLIREGHARVLIAKAEVQAAQKAVMVKEAEAVTAKATFKVSQAEVERLKNAMNRTGGAILVSKGELAIGETQALAARGRVEAAQAAIAGAQAEVEVKKGQVLLAEAALEALTANLEAAKLNQEKARLALEQTRIVTPIDGVVTRCDVHVGDFVRSDASGTPTSLLTVQGTGRLRVVVGIPDKDAPLAEPGSPVDLSFDALPGVKIAGKIARTAFVLNEKTRTMRVEIDLPNPAGLIRPGMSGQASVHLLKSPNALRVPLSALLMTTPGGVFPIRSTKGLSSSSKFVLYVVREGKAFKTPVEVGFPKGGEVEIFSGVRPNDLVVTDARGLSGESVAVLVAEKR